MKKPNYTVQENGEFINLKVNGHTCHCRFATSAAIKEGHVMFVNQLCNSQCPLFEVIDKKSNEKARVILHCSDSRAIDVVEEPPFKIAPPKEDGPKTKTIN